MKVGVSACLTGCRCKYNGKDNWHPGVLQFLEGREVVPVCPEMAGGLPCPRTPCELKNGRVISRTGQDCTEAYERGAELCLEQVRDCDLVILQPRSPSCGVSQVYDGSFSGTLISGSGLFAQRLKEAGIPVLEADAF